MPRPNSRKNHVISPKKLLDYTAPRLLWIAEARHFTEFLECDVIGVFSSLRQAESVLRPDNVTKKGWFVVYPTELDSDDPFLSNFPELMTPGGALVFRIYDREGKRLKKQPVA
jgi:hypothetical protein